MDPSGICTNGSSIKRKNLAKAIPTREYPLLLQYHNMLAIMLKMNIKHSLQVNKAHCHEATIYYYTKM